MWFSAVLAACSGPGLIFFLLLPGQLASHEHVIRTVNAKFKTLHEEQELRAQAEVLDEPIFEMLYGKTRAAEVPAYLPPRDSAAHTIVTALSKLLQVTQPVAAKEDLLPSPPAPLPDLFINDAELYLMQAKTVNWLVGAFRIGTAAALIVFGGAALWFKRRGRLAFGNPGA